MSIPYPPSPDVRLSDEERTNAMSALGRAFSEGRLSMDEYDQRCQEITAAQRRSELTPIFHDLPNTIHQDLSAGPMYSAQEIHQAFRSGQRIRFGVFALTTVATLTTTPVLIALYTPAFSVLFALIPIMFIVLYIMKMGPASWHAPSPRKLEHERLKSLRTAQALESAERRVANEARLAQLRAERQRLAGELTNEAMSFAKRSIDRLRR